MTPAYPLAWPPGWPRTIRRRKSAFKITFSKAYKQLLSELRHMQASHIVISSNMPLNASGQPYADNAARILADPGVAVYFTLKGQPRVMARDIYQTAGGNLRCLGLALKALRDLERHGGSYMMERAFSGFVALPNPETEHWSAVFGLKPDATLGQMEEAYRRLAREHHPDAGGSDQMMACLNAARAQALKERP